MEKTLKSVTTFKMLNINKKMLFYLLRVARHKVQLFMSYDLNGMNKTHFGSNLDTIKIADKYHPGGEKC